MPTRPLAAVLAAALAWCLASAAVPAVAAEPELTPFVAEALWAPNPASGSDGRRHLVYELRIANTTGSGLELKKVEVLDEPSGKVLLSLDRDGLAKRFSIGGRRGAETADLGFGQFGVLFLHVALDPGDALPRAIAHRISLRLVQPGVDFSATVARTPVVDRPPVVLGPPLIGTGYVAGDGCCDSIRHVRALLALNGHFTLAQRFAIDWEQADSENRLVKGDTKTLSNYTIYGREVLAVADGAVVSSRNDLPEQVPGALPQGMTVDRADGNFVVLDIGGSYVLYAHMQPGSVTVKAGASVKRGDVLGKVGNTGNTQAPHLHLHVMDGPSPLVSNGIPYVFESFKLTAIDKAGTADFDKAEATGSPLTLTPVSPPQVLSRVLPLDLSVVEFSR
jgi:hypothetical protein